MKEIELTRGKVALVDDGDYDWLNGFKWLTLTANKKMYAARAVRRKGMTAKWILMHRLIMDAPDGMEVDHMNGDGLDNQRVNLRICTVAENRRNNNSAKGTSGFKGVCWDKVHNKWVADICLNYKCKRIGYYDNPLDAAKAYDREALILHGDFAKTNKQLGKY